MTCAQGNLYPGGFDPAAYGTFPDATCVTGSQVSKVASFHEMTEHLLMTSSSTLALLAVRSWLQISLEHILLFKAISLSLAKSFL